MHKHTHTKIFSLRCKFVSPRHSIKPKDMEFVIDSLRPVPGKKRTSTPLGLPISIERSYSSMSGLSFGRQNSLPPDAIDVSYSGMDTPVDYSINCQRLPSSDMLDKINRRLSSPQIDEFSMSGFLAPRQQSQMSFTMEQLTEEGPSLDASAASPKHDGDTPEDPYDSSLEYSPVSSRVISTEAPSTPLSPNYKPSRRNRADSSVSNISFVLESNPDYDELDQSRPWEIESSEKLNTVPEGYQLPSHPENNLSLGDLRVIGRLHVQRIANQQGIRLPPGMTNSDLVELADSLGLYPLIYRLHLEATGQIEVPELHELYLQYKKESKARARVNKANKDMQLASRTRLLPDGRVTIDYFDGISLRLGRERDTIFRPLLHRLFREYKEEIRASLNAVGLNYSGMRKWKETQLCTALYVADKFAKGVWQSAVDTHLSKTKEFM